jgi:hypothetical protein
METFLQQRKEFLSELAYQIIFEWQKIDKKAFAALKKQHMWILMDDNSLSMLYRRKNKGEYWFVHQSLEKFFAVKQFIKNIESKKGKVLEKYFDKVFCLQKANQIDYSDIWQLIYDMLSEQDNAQIRNKLLCYLLDKEQDKMKTSVIYKQIYCLFRDSLEEMKK